MNLILFDTAERNRLYPFTLTRAVADMRIGILTTKERWERLTGAKAFVLAEDHLQPLYEQASSGEYIFIDSRILPSIDVVENILALKPGNALQDEGGLIAGKATFDAASPVQSIEQLFTKSSSIPAVKGLIKPWNIFQHNAEMLAFDFNLITKGRKSQAIDDSNRASGADNIFIEKGAIVSHSILNASTGCIYIGKDAVVMEGCMLRGPIAVCQGAVLKLGTKMYGATTIGPYCDAGGEIKNSVLFGYSNKAHDGYLGDSVVGEWCNFGAGATVSNVKNTGGEVKVWDRSTNTFVGVGNKCGVMMGDYSRVAINTAINTGTVIGVCANIFCSGLTPKVIHDFSWGCDGEVYDTGKAINDINNWKQFKGKTITNTEVAVLKHIFERNNYTQP